MTDTEILIMKLMAADADIHDVVIRSELYERETIKAG